MTGKAAQLEGQRFGRLKVISRIGSNKGQALWRCLCNCGNFKETTTRSLTSLGTQSCGCLNDENRRKPHKPTYFLPPGTAAKNRLMTAYRRSAKTRGKLFLLTLEQATVLFEQNCFYCGAKPSNYMISPRSNGGYQYNGIDRINNSLHYIADNCVSCCSICNRMKSTLDKDSFLMHVKRIADRIGHV